MRTEILAVGGVVLAALAAEAQGSPASRPTGACFTVWVTASAAPGRDASPRRRSLEFSAREVLDLEFFVLMPRSSSSGKRIELKLFTPRGHLYQTLSMSARDASPSTRRRRIEAQGASLPVAGTTIVNNSLYGQWRAEAYVEGESSPCAKPRSFEIAP